ncbi:MAG: alpha/beta hydrolase [Microcella sp.]|uniref:alpha/beta hydrolase n=1 Tax=Microcella sp. TaxID=1913979 RepID=UPI0033146272
MNERESLVQTLSDGRQLGFARYGPEGGSPVLYFTGGNSSRLEGRWFADAVERQGIDLIVPDRPGFGLSDYQPSRRFLDWPLDVAQLADGLSLDQFAVLGLSGGAPHVAAVMHELPQRVTRAAIVSGVAPPEMPKRLAGAWPPLRAIFWAARRSPRLLTIMLRQMSAFYSDPVAMQRRMTQALPQPDVQLIERDPAIIEIFSAAAGEAHRHGVDGDVLEWQLYNRPWGFDIADLTGELGLWFGRVDRNVPVAMGEYWAGKVPRAVLHRVEDGGHFSTINNHIDEILEYLTVDQRRSSSSARRVAR